MGVNNFTYGSDGLALTRQIRRARGFCFQSGPRRFQRLTAGWRR